jgi:predicted TIM-barrel fold metal-dependent hydrolase
MIDCHFHTRTDDSSTPEKRAALASWLREEFDALGVDKACLIGQVGETVEECREYNRQIAKYVEEHPDLFYGWARVDPHLGEEGVAEFRRAVEEDGLVGLKHYSLGTSMSPADPAFEPFAEAAVEMDVPIIEHVVQRLPRDERDPNEAYSEDTVAVCERYPDLKFVAGHIGGGGDWEYRIKNIRHHDNAYLDVSGTNCDRGMIEMAHEHLGPERLVWGSDNVLIPDIGKLTGADIPAEDKVEIAYKMEDLLDEHVPNAYGEAELADLKAERLEWFEGFERPREPEIAEANAYVGKSVFRQLDCSPGALVAYMDEKGVDRAVVSSLQAVTYRNVQPANEELAAAVDGHKDRLVPVATVNPSYPAWREDLEACIEELGMEGVRLLPGYHAYDLDDPAVVDCLDYCAERDVPVFLAAALEDQRQRHPATDLPGVAKDRYDDEQVENLLSLLHAASETDVVIADAWSHVWEVNRSITTHRDRVYLRQRERSGATYFVLDDLWMWYADQSRRIVDEIGPDRLVCGAQLPHKYFESYHGHLEHLPLDEAEKRRIRSENLLSLFE